MSYQVALAGAMIVLLFTVGAAGWIAGRRVTRTRAPAVGAQRVAGIGSPVGAQHVASLGSEVAGAGLRSVRSSTPATAVDPPFSRSGLDAESQFALTACLFATTPSEHLCWTAMVVDPALPGTPGHVRLVGRYETELCAIDAAAHLADALNECLIPGEAPLTATALGIEPAVTPSHTADGPRSAETSRCTTNR